MFPRGSNHGRSTETDGILDIYFQPRAARVRKTVQGMDLVVKKKEEQIENVKGMSLSPRHAS